MKRIILVIVIFIMSAQTSMAAKLPDDVRRVFKQSYPTTIFRFDGMITLPDGTLYLPLYPALVKKPEKIQIAKTIPANKRIIDKPEIIILNNDFAFLKVMTDSKGRKTVAYLSAPPIEVKTGLLPQDLLVPTGLIIPENIKGIIGNLKIETANDAGLRIAPDKKLITKAEKATSTKATAASIAQLKDRVMYIATCYSKNIQVVVGENSKPSYALSEKGLILDLKATPDERFLFTTIYGKKLVDVISLADDKIIRQIELPTQGEEILIDEKTNKAYVSSSEASTIYVIDIATMQLKQKIKVKGRCEHLSFADNNNKIFYTDKRNGDIWVIELDNNFLTQNMGSFPSVSSIKYTQGKIYATSRVKNHLAIIDYVTTGLISEIPVDTKPVDMLVYKNHLYILSAETTKLTVLNTLTDTVEKVISLNTGGFSTKIHRIKNTNIAIVTDTKANKYSVIDLDKKALIKTNIIDVPVSQIAITRKIPKINK